MSFIVNAVQSLVTILYKTTLPLQNVVCSFGNAILSFLPRKTQRRINFFHDMVWAMICLAIGRIQPSLRPYLPKSPNHLTGKTAIVTGSNSGIGLQIAKDLAGQGAEVVLAVRSTERGETAKREIIDQLPQARDRVKVMTLDTSSLDSVRKFVETWTTATVKEGGSNNRHQKKLDILVHNAGLAAGADSAKEFTEDGFQLVYATNFLGSFLLTHLLEPYLADDARIILTSSTGHYGSNFGDGFKLEKVVNTVEPGFHVVAAEKVVAVRDTSIPNTAYSQSKCMQCAFARALQKKWTNEGTKRLAHSFSPGFTSTAIFGKYKVRNVFTDPVFGIIQATTVVAMTPSEGAATGTWLASAPISESKDLRRGGLYWDRMICRLSKADLLEESMLDRFWIRWSKDAGIEWS